jgi:hypothetical protein
VPEPSPPTVPPPGAALLEQLLTALADRVPGTLGAAVAVPAGQPEHPDVLGAVGTVAPWLPAALAAALRRREPVLVTEGDGGVLAVVDGREPTGPGVAVGIVLDRAPGPADADLAGAALPVIASAVAVLQEWAAETERAEQMVQMVQYRRVIEQAKGLVMAVTRTDAAAAFATLARASQHFNVRLRNLAVALVELVGGAPAEGPDDPAAVVVPGERDRRAAVRMWAALSAEGSPGSGRGGPGEI